MGALGGIVRIRPFPSRLGVAVVTTASAGREKESWNGSVPDSGEFAFVIVNLCADCCTMLAELPER